MEALDIVIVEDSKPMQMILRSILLSMRVARVRVYDSPENALDAMLVEPPNLILTDWKMGRVSGYHFLRTIRHRKMAPLCFVPVIFVTAFGTRDLVEKVLRAGAHHLLVKPLAPSTLFNRLQWLIADERQFVLDEATGYHTIAGVDAALAADLEKRRSLQRARMNHQHAAIKVGQEALVTRRLAVQKAQERAKLEAAAENAAAAAAERNSSFADIRPSASDDVELRAPAPAKAAAAPSAAPRPGPRVPGAGSRNTGCAFAALDSARGAGHIRRANMGVRTR
ncbi:response regulator [Breoghania sp. L-A4]|uniref:response regulator n=1 Tax=Breoghania sp. L-A4 TaxID=2304600 RepID=UPI00196739C1|nr:response regulator [Breoghania sp. L-A4]